MTIAEAIAGLGLLIQAGIFTRLGRLAQASEDLARRVLRLEDWKDGQK